MIKLWLVLVLYLIGLGSGARFLDQSNKEVLQKRSKFRITFGTQLKMSLKIIHETQNHGKGTSSLKFLTVMIRLLTGL